MRFERSRLRWSTWNIHKAASLDLDSRQDIRDKRQDIPQIGIETSRKAVLEVHNKNVELKIPSLLFDGSEKR